MGRDTRVDATPTTGQSIPYEPALDGLRGLAVLFVVLYHDGQSFQGTLPGGYLGVDVFFVLSGYLITSILLVEHASAGRIDVIEFWRRRARRLLPALLVMLLMTVAIFRVIGGDQDALRAQALATLGYVANWAQMRVGPTLLAHTWSLSVEEQWYLGFPLLLGAVLWLRRRRGWSPVATLGVLTLASAAITPWWYTTASATRAYLGTDTRAQELLVGTLLAVVLSNRGRAIGSRAARDTAAIIGLAVVAVSALTVHTTSAVLFRCGMLVVAVAVAAVLNAVHARDESIVRRALRARGLVAVGTLSYGIYLFHFPLFQWLSPERVTTSHPVLLAVRLAATFVVAAASYRLVERPIRRGALRRFRPTVLAVGASVAVAAVVVVGVGFPTEYHDPRGVARLRAAASGIPPARRLLVVGDTSALSLPAHHGAQFDAVTYGLFGCGIAHGDAYSRGRRVDERPMCAASDTLFAAAIRAFAPATVVLVTGSSESVARLIDGRRVAPGEPTLGKYLDAQLDRFLRITRAAHARLAVATPMCGLAGARPGATAWLADRWRAWVRRNQAEVVLIDLHRTLCEPPRSGAVVQGLWSAAGAAQAWQAIEAALQAAPVSPAVPPTR